MTSGSYLAAGTLFAGRYEIGRELGRGGVSVVYAAHDRQVGQDVALKLLVPSPATANTARERMRREVHAVRRLAHPNIVAVYDFVEDGAYGAVVMELVDGEDLDRRVRRSGPLTADDVAQIGTEVAAALSAAHRHGILHRDVKPQNILLARDGRARLTDFGSARMDGEATITRTGAIVGTLAYMAPETVSGRRGDARADVFALGMTLFHAVAGRLPDRPSPHLPLPPSPTGHTPIALGIDVPIWLAHVIARSTSADPTDRYPTPVALGDALAHRDAGAATGLAKVSRDRCVLCDSLDMLGTGVCTACASGSTREDGYVFVAPPRSAAERDLVLEAMAGLLGGDTPTSVLASVTNGTRPLMRVPMAAKPRVTEVLAGRGFRARVVPGKELYRALPAGFVLLILAVVVVGLVTGAMSSSGIASTAIPFALLLTIGATLSLRHPAVTSEPRPSALGTPARARVVETFAALQPGPARSLLADVVRRGQSVQRGLATRRDPLGTSVMVDALIVAACDGARDLASIDESLALFERERAHDDADTRWIDSYAECERTRDAAVQRLLDAITVLGQLDAQSMRGAEDIGNRLNELVEELSSDVKARAAARDEIRSLLST